MDFLLRHGSKRVPKRPRAANERSARPADIKRGFGRRRELMEQVTTEKYAVTVSTLDINDDTPRSMQLPSYLLRKLQRSTAAVCQRTPAKTIGTNYLTRWYVIPRNRLFNIYLHHVQSTDPDNHLHDHPWLFNFSVILRGEIIEQRNDSSRPLHEGSVTARLGRSAHRLLLRSPDSLTLFVTGPKIRRWGFYTRDGWVDSREYLRSGGNGRTVHEAYRSSTE